MTEMVDPPNNNKQHESIPYTQDGIYSTKHVFYGVTCKESHTLLAMVIKISKCENIIL